MANTLSKYPDLTGGSGSNAAQVQNNIAYLLNPYANFDETKTNAAEAAVGGGFGGGGFAQGQQNRLLDSERISRMKLGADLLDPYLQRDQQASLQANAEAARLNEIAAQGAQALQQLQLQEAGLNTRSTQAENARLQLQIQEGKDAMARLGISEAGATGRNTANIAGQQANTRLNIGGNLLQQYFKDLNGRRPGENSSSVDWRAGPGAGGLYTPTSGRDPLVGGSGNGGTVDLLLKKYGLLN